MNNLIQKWLAVFFFILFSVSSMLAPTIVSANETTAAPETSGEPPEEEEPECD